jgi:hypothetical protein
MNPKALPRHQLLGSLNPDTREWADGVLTAAARRVSKEPPEQGSWVVCDGDVDPEWIESLNSVLDDNRWRGLGNPKAGTCSRAAPASAGPWGHCQCSRSRPSLPGAGNGLRQPSLPSPRLLTLPNGERIQFGSNVNFVFECHSLEFASPATVSRCAAWWLRVVVVLVVGLRAAFRPIPKQATMLTRPPGRAAPARPPPPLSKVRHDLPARGGRGLARAAAALGRPARGHGPHRWVVNARPARTQASRMPH